MCCNRPIDIALNKIEKKAPSGAFFIEVRSEKVPMQYDRRGVFPL